MNHGKLDRTIHHSLITNHRGFTLLELLVVIGVLGILAIAVFTALNVISNLNKATLARAKTFSASVENALSINQVGRWSFEETTSPFKDTSGYGNDGSCSGTSCPTSENATDCDLGYGRCLKFDGVDDYVALGNNLIFNQDGSTIQFWFRPLVGSTYMVIVRFRSPTSLLEFLFALGGTASFPYSTYFGFRGYNAIVNTEAKYYLDKFENQWRHFAITYNGGAKGLASSYKVYINGSPIPLSNIGGIGGGGNANEIGRNEGGGDWTNGYMDELTIYNQALTLSQIQHLYAQRLPRHQLARQ